MGLYKVWDILPYAQAQLAFSLGKTLLQFYLLLPHRLRIIKLLRLEETTQIICSSHQFITTMPTKHFTQTSSPAARLTSITHAKMVCTMGASQTLVEPLHVSRRPLWFNSAKPWHSRVLGAKQSAWSRVWSSLCAVPSLVLLGSLTSGTHHRSFIMATSQHQEPKAGVAQGMGLSRWEGNTPKEPHSHCSCTDSTRGVCGEWGQNESGRTVSYFEHRRTQCKKKRTVENSEAALEWGFFL